MTFTDERDTGIRFKVNHRDKYLPQRSFTSQITVWTHTDGAPISRQHTVDYEVEGQAEWLI